LPAASILDSNPDHTSVRCDAVGFSERHHVPDGLVNARERIIASAGRSEASFEQPLGGKHLDSCFFGDGIDFGRFFPERTHCTSVLWVGEHGRLEPPELVPCSTRGEPGHCWMLL
jgi:hypothetical protein